ncbi:hypothetical protein [Pseudoalteromonas denitrificans]|uniref:Uncharacterized protein n=1 Tax=Pseudoalteromonas denitrificans DSM 6059 TaxID=1123010 RepID=A0A1I1TIM9_9GAMM|nr:hypothetical protein [Pseudoalteromonas denitrificans]SFD55340.1 hypothetical protein SAMN02745724_04834 [Pseudoalteromonas denitrificans DSM 6059]
MLLLPLPKKPKTCVFRLVPNSQSYVSKANNASEIYDLEGAYWEFEIEIANVPEKDALTLDAFMASLRGQVGTFLMFDYRREQLDKSFSAFVAGANQDGNTLLIDGLPVSQTLAVAGERFQLGDGSAAELKMLTKDLVSDAFGRANIVFESPMRVIPFDNTPLYFKQPKGVFRLADNKQGIASARYKNGIVISWRIKGREAF